MFLQSLTGIILAIVTSCVAKPSQFPLKTIPHEENSGSVCDQFNSTLCEVFPLSICCSAIGVGQGLPQDTTELELDHCKHPSYRCVPHFYCDDGIINKVTPPLFNLSFRKKERCIDPEFPDVPSYCCLLPGATSTPPSVDYCPTHEKCVDYSLCTNDGVITNVVRNETSYDHNYVRCNLPNNEEGRCCNIPPPIVESCPDGSRCRSLAECSGLALDSINRFMFYRPEKNIWATCSVNSENGVCCKPKVVEVCPNSSTCVTPGECRGKVLDDLNDFLDYKSADILALCHRKYENGHCCIPPPPKIIDICPYDSECIPSEKCTGVALNDQNNFDYYQSQGQWVYCSNSHRNVCCLNSYIKPDLKPRHGCGMQNLNSDKRITSGSSASFGEFPWYSLIFHNKGEYICGGSLISEWHVLTAAHCVDGLNPNDLYVRFGEWKINNFDEDLPHIDRSASAIYTHSKYRAKILENDLAVIVLQTPIDFQFHINSVCLPKRGLAFGANATCFSSGWGKDALRQGTLPYVMKKIEFIPISHDRCSNLLRRTRLGRYYNLHESFVCAGSEEDKADPTTCHTDGGGPLMCQLPQSSNFVLIGVASWNVGCGRKNVPIVFADVENSIQWIEEIIEKQMNSKQDIHISLS